MQGLFKFLNMFSMLAERTFTTQVDNPSFFETLGIIIWDFFTDVLLMVFTVIVKIVYVRRKT